jgi:predicted dehydrogenase
MKPIVTGILSYGMSGRIFHAPFIHLDPRFELRAFTERSRKIAQNDYPGTISYDSVEELLCDNAIELVIVNTPNNTHDDLARQCLRAGKHVLVEKPFASSSVIAEALFALGEKMGKHVMAYQNRRWDSDFLSVKNVIESGKLGRLIEVNFRFDRYKKELSPKKFKEEILPASGLTYDLGPHLLDQVISLFGVPQRSRKVNGIYRPDSVVDDYVSWQLLYPDKLRVNVTSSLLTAEPVPSFILHGVNGSYLKARSDIQEAQLDQRMSPADPAYGMEPTGNEGLLVTMTGGVKNTEHVHAPKGDYRLLFEAVYNQIRNGKPFPVRKEEVIGQLKLLEMPSAG